MKEEMFLVVRLTAANVTFLLQNFRKQNDHHLRLYFVLVLCSAPFP